NAKVYDMVYTNSGTPLLRSASLSGLRAANGIGMLIAQGERAYRIWTGTNPPKYVMRHSLNSL
ncbi:MAG: shikimate dehydrogenase, partial [Desulfuromonadaceae bacterium]|nr:shikimate dehydrogenase [Desulfuromonadaceae bacterium]